MQGLSLTLRPRASYARRLYSSPAAELGARAIYTLLLLIILTVLCGVPSFSQSTVSGDILGTVTDPTGAVVPNAAVKLTNNATGQTQTHTTNAQGFYRFSLLAPGNYTIVISAPNFQTVSRTVPVTVGQATTANATMTLGAASQTVQVTSEAPVIQTENGNVSTTFNADQISLAPNPGNDLS